MKQRFSWVKGIITKEYIQENRLTLITLTILAVLFIMIGRNLLHAIDIGFESSALRREAARYQERITEDSTIIENLKYDSELERYAREKYFLQRKDEEIFIIEPD